jgi:hypothetical protein
MGKIRINSEKEQAGFPSACWKGFYSEKGVCLQLT